MKRIVIKSMVVLSLVMAGTMNTTTLLAQTQESQQVEETPAQRKAREKAERKAAKEAEKARKAAEKAEKARKAEEEKIAKIIAAQKAAAAKNGVVEEQKPATTYGPEWGENATAAEREENVRIFNFFGDAYNNKDYDKALEYMYTLIQNCPKARSSVYSNGANILRNKIARSKSMDEKLVHIEALMKLWDLRLAAFADDEKYGEVYILKNKAKDYYKYRSEDKQGMLQLFREAIEKDPEVDATFINQYFTVLVEEYDALNVETDHFMSEYEFMASKMDLVEDAEAKTTFDALLIKSGAADCTNLEKIFGERLANNPDDAAQIEKAFKLFAEVDWTKAETGKMELDGKEIFANVQERALKTKEEAKMEVHDKYIDIQILISGAEEQFGWADRSTLTQPKEAFNEEKDIQFFEDAPQTYYTMRPGQFTILFPEDAHAPLVGEGTMRKVILKVLK